MSWARAPRCYSPLSPARSGRTAPSLLQSFDFTCCGLRESTSFFHDLNGASASRGAPPSAVWCDQGVRLCARSTEHGGAAPFHPPHSCRASRSPLSNLPLGERCSSWLGPIPLYCGRHRDDSREPKLALALAALVAAPDIMAARRPAEEPSWWDTAHSVTGPAFPRCVRPRSLGLWQNNTGRRTCYSTVSSQTARYSSHLQESERAQDTATEDWRNAWDKRP